MRVTCRCALYIGFYSKLQSEQIGRGVASVAMLSVIKTKQYPLNREIKHNKSYENGKPVYGGIPS